MNLAIGFWSKVACLRISACDDNVSVIAIGEKVTKIKCCVICIVEEDQPLLAISRKPDEGVTR